MICINDSIIENVEKLLKYEELHDNMSNAINPYEDVKRIV